MEKQTIIKAICAASEEVFSTMLGLTVTFGDVYEREETEYGGDGVLALIGIAGPWIGTGAISCSPDFACKISSLLLSAEYRNVDPDVLDAMAEIANMIFGNVKTTLESHVGPLGLSIPTVLLCRNFRTRQTGSELWMGVPLYAGGMRMELRLSLRRNNQPGAEVCRCQCFQHTVTPAGT